MNFMLRGDVLKDINGILKKVVIICLVILFFSLQIRMSGSAAPQDEVYFDMVIDDARQKIYASDRAGGAVRVVSMETLHLLTSIPVGSQPAGMDMDPTGNELAVALYGQAEVAFIDLNTLTVTSRVTPTGTLGVNQPFDVIYGRMGRLYSVGNPDSAGLDYVHVFSTETKTELGRSSEPMRASPRLAITADRNTLYVSQVTFSPNKIYRFDITTDTPLDTAETPHSSAVNVNTLCVVSDGRVISSKGQVWPANLSTMLATLPVTGSEIEYSEAQGRVYISSGAAIHAYDTNNYARVWAITYAYGTVVGVARLNSSGSTLYVSTSAGIQPVGTDFQVQGYWPLQLKELNRNGINGQVKINGTRAPGVTLELRRLVGNTWITQATTTTNAEGYYQFIAAPALGSGQKYYVRYQNTDGIHGLLWAWGTREITSYPDIGGGVEVGNFDIADIQLDKPTDGVTTRLPATFQWMPRQASLSDTYEFDLYDPNDGNPYFYSQPPLGYVSSYTLNSRPSGFSTGVPYAWEIWTYSPDGGAGVSYETRIIRFSSSMTGGDARAMDISRFSHDRKGDILGGR